MNSTLIDALRITLYGMGLVFMALILLWGLMKLLVRITARKTREEMETAQPAAPAEGLVTSPPVAASIPTATPAHAAAAAVAVALALRAHETASRPPRRQA